MNTLEILINYYDLAPPHRLLYSARAFANTTAKLLHTAHTRAESQNLAVCNRSCVRKRQVAVLCCAGHSRLPGSHLSKYFRIRYETHPPIGHSQRVRSKIKEWTKSSPSPQSAKTTISRSTFQEILSTTHARKLHVATNQVFFGIFGRDNE